MKSQLRCHTRGGVDFSHALQRIFERIFVYVVIDYDALPS